MRTMIPAFGRRSERLFIALILLTVIVGVIAYAIINTARTNGRASFNARTDVAALVQLVIDQETGVRGYTLTRDRVFLEPYLQATAAYPATLAGLLYDARFAPASVRAHINAFDEAHTLLVRSTLVPLIAGRERNRSTLLLRGKATVDAMRRQATSAQDELLESTGRIGETINRAIILSIGSIVFLTIVLGGLALAFERSRFAFELRLRAELADRNVSLERSNSMLAHFAHVASHDLQEPLRTVANFTELLRTRYGGKLDAEADEFIGFAVDGTRRMQVLIDDIFAYSRVTTRGSTFIALPLEIPLTRALTNLHALVAERGAEIARPETLPSVCGDATQIEQLFSNLIANAIKYNTSERPRVGISAETKGGMVITSVKDNGIGVAAADHERIFSIFTRLHRIERAGTGLGLALAVRVVEAHGGRIWVESVEGEGSTFYFALPVAKEALS